MARERDQAADEIERLLQDAQERISRVSLDISGFSAPPPPRDYFQSEPPRPTEPRPARRAYFEDETSRPTPHEIPAPPVPEPPAASPAIAAAEPPAYAEPKPPAAAELGAAGSGPQAPTERQKSRSIPLPQIASALGMLIAVGGGLAFWSLLKTPARPEHEAYALPYTKTAGLAHKEGRLYAYEPREQMLVALDPNGGGTLATQKFQNPSLTALAADKAGFWSCDAEAGYVYQHNLDYEHSLKQAFPNPRRAPTALYSDGARLWINDARTETIQVYGILSARKGGGLNLEATHALPGTLPAGLHHSEGMLWVFDSISRALTRYQIASRLSARDRVSLKDAIPQTAEVTGFAVGERDLWVATENPAQLHRFDLTSLAWSAAGQ